MRGLPAFQIHGSNPFLDGFSVSPGNLITTLPTWGPEFKLSFELYFNSFNSRPGYAQILHFKPEYIFCDISLMPKKYNREDLTCDRIPAVFELDRKVYVFIYYGSVYSYDVSVKTWMKIEISLFNSTIGEEVHSTYFLYNSYLLLRSLGGLTREFVMKNLLGLGDFLLK